MFFVKLACFREMFVVIRTGWVREKLFERKRRYEIYLFRIASLLHICHTENMSTLFKKTPENFTCLHCGASVQGNGYTNHCPVCLWSRHVDVHPGDRASECGGMMEPVSVLFSRNGWILTHRCVLCGYEKRNRSADEDDREVMIRIARSMSDGITRGNHSEPH